MTDRDHLSTGATPAGETAHETAHDERRSIPRPADEEVTYRVNPGDELVGATKKRRFDLPATLGGTMAALGTVVLLSALASAIIGTIGYQSDVEGRDLSIGGLVAGLVVLFLACLVGGWVAGRMARHRGGLHGLVAILWLIVLAAIVAGLAALAGDEFDITDRLSLPDWFSADALTTGAIISGVVALLLALLGGWLGGRLGARHHRHDDTVSLVSTRRRVHERPGGITSRVDTSTGTTTATTTDTTRSTSTGRTTR